MARKFPTAHVAALQNDLLQNGLDCFQMAESIKVFLAAYGYGISPERARDAAIQLELGNHTLESFHQQLEALALPI